MGQFSCFMLHAGYGRGLGLAWYSRPEVNGHVPSVNGPPPPHGRVGAMGTRRVRGLNQAAAHGGPVDAGLLGVSGSGGAHGLKSRHRSERTAAAIRMATS